MISPPCCAEPARYATPLGKRSASSIKWWASPGAPGSLPDAENLAAQDPYQFQWWALRLVGARPVQQKKG